MKTIVISGACSNVGKTTLARAIRDILLPYGAVFVKIGNGVKKENSTDLLYPIGTPFEAIKADHKAAAFLIIESNRILNELKPDLCIFLDNLDGQKQKPSAALARQKADLIRGQRLLRPGKILAQRLGIGPDKMREICFLSGSRPEPVSVIIMAGGASSRMGRDKALLTIEGKTIIRHLYDTLSRLSDEIIISVSKTTEGTREKPLIRGAKTVIDQQSGQGPLMGIYSSLCASSNEVNFVIACDIPRINFPLLYRLLSCSYDYDIVVPSFKPGKYEPLFAVYTKRVTPAARSLLDQDQRKITRLFSLCKTKVLETPEADWYANLNTPQDYLCFIGKK